MKFTKDFSLFAFSISYPLFLCPLCSDLDVESLFLATIYHWFLIFPERVSLFFVCLIAILTDFLWEYPIGITVVKSMMLYLAIHSLRPLLLTSSFLIRWLFITAFIALIKFLSVFYFLTLGTKTQLLEIFFKILFITLLYPLINFVLLKLSRDEERTTDKTCIYTVKL